MGSLATSESGNGNGDGGACENNILDKFIQLVLSVIVAGFIFFLGVVIVQIAPKIYNALNPSTTTTQKTLNAVQGTVSWLLTLIIMVSGYLFMFVGVLMLLSFAVIFLYRLIAKVKEAESSVKPVPAVVAKQPV
jgi:uncharacterized membrane protein